MIESNIDRRLSGINAEGKKVEISNSDLLGRIEPTVVLGDAGMGKTTLLEQLGKEDSYKFVHARRLVRSPDPSTLLGDATTFVIDALDELTLQKEGDAVDAVLAALEYAGSPNFILACGAADWRSATSIQAVADTYGNEPLELFLEPINRDEARNLLSQDVGEKRADEVIEHFEHNGLEELFGNPQTLKLIVAVAGDADLPTSRAGLFELATKRLWAEHSKKRSDSRLSQLNEEQALNAAGSVFAVLILAGKRALSRLPIHEVDETDLPMVEMNKLTPKSEIDAVLESRLFSSNIEGSPDRFGYTHRSVGEFLAARWLAKRADTDRKRRRLLKIFQGHGLVPASLRGVYAWLARDPRFALKIIAFDPMGIVEYGDTDELSDEQARALLTSLFNLGDRDPRNYDFHKKHTIRGIAKLSLCKDIKKLITAESTPFSLRAMLLHSVYGTPVAIELAKTLEEMVLNPEVSFYERRAAGAALADLPAGRIEWARVFSELYHLVDESSLRLAIELLPGVGFVGPTDEQIVELVVAFSGLSVCEYPQIEKTRMGGVFWRLERELPHERIESVLDILTDYLNALLSEEYDVFENADAINVVYTLAERRLALGQIDPLKMWHWLSSVREFRVIHDSSLKAISDWLKNNDGARREIQRFVLLEESGAENVWMRGWRLNDRINGLHPDEADVVALLEGLDPSVESSKDSWQDLVRLCSHDEEHGLIAREAAARFVTTLEDRKFISRLTNPEVPDWQIEQDKRDQKRKKERQESWEQHRASFLEHIDDLRNGKFGEVVNPAKAYLNLYSNMGDDAPAHERIAEWLGAELQDAAFQGFEVFLVDPKSKPTAAEIAKSYAESRRWDAAIIFVAAVAERVRNQIPLDDLPDDRLLAIFLEIRFTSILNHASIDHVSEAVEKELKKRTGLWERFWRLRIEPQLRAKNKHVEGLYQIARGSEDPEMAIGLAADWLERFSDMSHEAEIELIDCLISASKFEVLRKFLEKHKNCAGTDDERNADWDVVAFLVDYANVQDQLKATRVKDKLFLWHLRSRLGGRRDENAPATLSPSQIGWIIMNFRSCWPYESHPMGSTSGNNNSWDAAEYLGALINRLGADTADEAIDELSALRDAPKDGYTDNLKRVFAEQAQKVVEENYTPPTITEICAVLNDGPPDSASQLQAIMIEELRAAQNKIRSHPVDWYRDFFDQGIPKDEEACRDTLLKLLGDYRYGIQCAPEGHLADDKRADIVCTIGELMLPIEVKGQWHKDLWHAADTQLEWLYGNDWRAERKGIYLVFWFGEKVPKNKKPMPPIKGINRPSTADELRASLIENSKAASQGRIEVVVLDLVRPQSL